MPHVYMVTTGPGEKSTTSPRAVSKNRKPDALGLVGGVDAGEAEAGLAEADQDRGERLHRAGHGQGTGWQRAQGDDGPHQPRRGLQGLGVVGADEDVAL